MVRDILTADRDTHTRQRRLLSHAFSEKALREQEGILQAYVDKLLAQLSFRDSSEPFDIVAWYNFTSTFSTAVIFMSSSDILHSL
jgi:cytochrome P450